MKMHCRRRPTKLSRGSKRTGEADIRAFDAVYDHILKMSDALADGIVKQFPDKFRS